MEQHDATTFNIVILINPPSGTVSFTCVGRYIFLYVYFNIFIVGKKLFLFILTKTIFTENEIFEL